MYSSHGKVRRWAPNSVWMSMLLALCCLGLSSCKDGERPKDIIGENIGSGKGTQVAALNDSLDDVIVGDAIIWQMLTIRDSIGRRIVERGIRADTLTAVCQRHDTSGMRILLGYTGAQYNALRYRLDSLRNAADMRYPDIVGADTSGECSSCRMGTFCADPARYVNSLTSDGQRVEALASISSSSGGGTGTKCKWGPYMIGLAACLIGSGGDPGIFAACAYCVYCSNCTGSIPSAICN